MIPVTVQLGEHEITVVPQRHAYLMHKVGDIIKTITAAGDDVTTDNLLEFASGAAYEVVCGLIPAVGKRIPRWEWEGYASQAAADMGEYDPEQDKSPDLVQMRYAIETGIKVNGLDFLGKARSVLPAETLLPLLLDKLTSGTPQS